MTSIPIRLMGAALVLVFLHGCAASPRQRPLPTARIEAEDQAVEQTRRQLEGTWVLQRFEIIEAGVARDVRAEARLTYDAYGNMVVKGALLDPPDARGAAAAQRLLDYSGRIVIDPARQEIRLADVRAETPVDDTARAVLDPARVRRYSFEDGRLVLLLMAPNDAPAARATFARSP